MRLRLSLYPAGLPKFVILIVCSHFASNVTQSRTVMGNVVHEVMLQHEVEAATPSKYTPTPTCFTALTTNSTTHTPPTPHVTK